MTAKRIIMSAVLGSIAAMALAVPAQAQTHTKDTACTIEGSATAVVNWGAHLGTYNFGPTGLGINCVFTTKKTVAGNKVAGSVEAGIAVVVAESAGDFENVVCGTGLAADGGLNGPTVTSVTTTPDSPNAEAALLGANLGYHIVFAAGEGALTWGDNATLGNPDANTAPSSTAPVGGGVINISPWRGAGHPLGSQGGTFPGSPPDGQCTNGFNVEGVVSGSLTSTN